MMEHKNNGNKQINKLRFLWRPMKKAPLKVLLRLFCVSMYTYISVWVMIKQTRFGID